MRLVGVALVALAVCAGALAFSASASERHPTQGELESELVCPTCHTTLDESEAPIAREMKAFVRRRIRQGATKSQIENELVDQFGPGVLGVPRKHGFDLLAWILPLGGIAVGAVGLGLGARHWSRTSRQPPAPPGPPLDPGLDRRVDEELARFDG